jgi:phospholipid/cholesterol/gamma-HCH transport system substrate-binding protein
MTSAVRASARSLLVGVLVLALFVASLFVAFTAGDGLPGRSYTYVRAAFTDVGALRRGDDVRRASVRVGQVHEIRATGDHAEVTLRLDGEQDVYRDARAAIWARSGLGKKFVEFAPGTRAGGRLAAADVLSTARTVSPYELDDVLGVLDARTRRAATGTLREVGGGAAGHSEDLAGVLEHAPDLLADLRTVAGAASAEEADLPELLRTADTLAGRFAGRERHLASLVERLDTTQRALTVDGAAPLGETLDRAPGALRSARTALTALRGPLARTGSAMRALQPGARSLGAAAPDLRGTLGEAVRPLRRVPGVARQAEPALDDLTGVVADARPLAPEVARALASARTPLDVLAPYSPEIALWFTYAADAISEGDEAGNWLRIDWVLKPESFTGATGLKDPFSERNPYPAPGQAHRNRSGAGR